MDNDKEDNKDNEDNKNKNGDKENINIKILKNKDIEGRRYKNIRII